MDWKRIGKKLLFPPVWVMLLLTLISAAALLFVFLNGLEEHPVAYITYVVAFYTLSVVCIYCSMVLPKQYKALRQKAYEYPLVNRYLTDRAYRTKLSLLLSLCIGLLYVGINLISWYFSRSWWFVVLAVYYGIMSCMRFLLVRYVRRKELGTALIDEWKRARTCACILLLVNLCLSGAVLMILFWNRGYDYPGMLIYVMAMYTFYSTIHAVLEIKNHRLLGSPVMSAAKVVSLSAALVSVLNLETAMFAQFGQEMSADDQRIFIMLTGAGIRIVVVTLSLLLILRANKEIRSLNNG